MLRKLQSVHRYAAVAQAAHGNKVKLALMSLGARAAGKIGITAMRHPMGTAAVAGSGLGLHHAGKQGATKAQRMYALRPQNRNVPFGHEGGMYG